MQRLVWWRREQFWRHPSSKPPYVSRKDPQGYWFNEGDTKVLFYQAERKTLPDGQAARSNYFHPLYDLDGNVLTEDFPKDHIHHRGIFWAWHQVRINGKSVQDQWMNSDSFWQVRDARTDSDSRSASLELRVAWESPLFTDAQGRRRPFVEERSVTRVHRAEGAIRKIDFHQQLTALVDGVEIGDRKTPRAMAVSRTAS